MDSPNEWSRPSTAHKDPRELYDKMVDRLSHEFLTTFGRVPSWLHSDDDTRPQDYLFTEGIHHEPSRHSKKKHRKDKSRDHRSRALEDIAEESGYEKQRRGRPRAPPDRGSLAKDPDRPREPRVRGSLAKGPYEPEEYDSDDSFTWSRKHKHKSNKHETNDRSYPSSKNHRTGSDRRKSQQAYSDSFERSRRFPSHEEVRPRLDSIHQHAAHNSDVGVLYEYYADSDEDVVYEHCAVHNADDDLVHEHWFYAEGVSLGRRRKHREPRAQHPSVHNRYEEFSDGRHNRGSDYAQHGRGHNWGSDFAQHGRDRNVDEDEYVPPRRIEGSDRHQCLLGPPSENGGRRDRH